MERAVAMVPVEATRLAGITAIQTPEYSPTHHHRDGRSFLTRSTTMTLDTMGMTQAKTGVRALHKVVTVRIALLYVGQQIFLRFAD